LATLIGVASASAQGAYPDKPVRFIVGFTAGSATDITARIFAQKFAEAWNVPVTVENVPGAGGRVTMTMQNMGTILPIVQQKQLRAIGVTSLKRSTVLPEIPTIAEQGLPGFEAISWFGLMAPAGTPAAIVDKVYKQAAQIVAAPEMKKKLAELGLDTTSDPPDAFGGIIRSDIAKWAKVIKEADIKAAQ
jgi:tripartite-type tricarboxylate transporter receptor subunit TctC